MHLRLPGHGPEGPTLEIYRYEPLIDDDHAPSPRRVGLGHLAFAVDDVERMRERVLAAGGCAVGEVVTVRSGDRDVAWCYVGDPEGNVIELQRWG